MGILQIPPPLEILCWAWLGSEGMMGKGARLQIIPSPDLAKRRSQVQRLKSLLGGLTGSKPNSQPHCPQLKPLILSSLISTPKLPSSNLTQIEPTYPRSLSSTPDPLVSPTPQGSQSALSHSQASLAHVVPRWAALPPPRTTAPAPLPGLTPGPLHLLCSPPPALPPRLCTCDNPLILHYHPLYFAFLIEYLDVPPLVLPSVCPSNLTPASLLGCGILQGRDLPSQPPHSTPDPDQDTSAEEVNYSL